MHECARMCDFHSSVRPSIHLFFHPTPTGALGSDPPVHVPDTIILFLVSHLRLGGPTATAASFYKVRQAFQLVATRASRRKVITSPPRNFHRQFKQALEGAATNMPSSKGKPTDPQKREEAHKEVLQMEKGGGKGQWSAWKASEMAKRYEAKGGDYEDTGDNANEAKKGNPKPKKEAVEKGERKDPSEPVGTSKSKNNSEKKNEASEPEESGSKRKPESKSGNGAKSKKAKKEAKPPTKGTREQPKRGVKK